ncbi:MAG: EamA family transporter [Tumebacillaceae bacterium]
MIVLSLFSSFLNAVNSLYAKKITQDIRDNNSFIVASFLFVGVFLACAMPFVYSFHATTASLLLLALVIVLDTTSNVLFFKALERIEVSSLAVYLSLTPFFTFVVNACLHGFSLHVLGSVVIIVFGVYLLNLKGKNLLGPFLELKQKGNLLALATAACFGISMVPTQEILVHGFANPPTLYMFRSFGIAVLIYALYRPKVWFPKQIMHLSFRGITVIGQWVALLTALRLADGTVVVALAYTSPLFAVLLARIFFRERVTVGKLVACVIIVLGIGSIH